MDGTEPCVCFSFDVKEIVGLVMQFLTTLIIQYGWGTTTCIREISARHKRKETT